LIWTAKPRSQSAPPRHNKEIESLFRFKGNADAEAISIATLTAKSPVARKRSGSYCTSSRKCRSAVIRAARSPPISQFQGIEMM
jgi:hypothetical protein